MGVSDDPELVGLAVGRRVSVDRGVAVGAVADGAFGVATDVGGGVAAGVGVGGGNGIGVGAEGAMLIESSCCSFSPVVQALVS